MKSLTLKCIYNARVNLLRFIGFAMVALVFGCKNQKEPKTPDIIMQDRLVVEVYAQIPKDDTFEVYYREENESYMAENSEASDVKGSDQLQKVVFTLEQQIFPTNIRLDFGNNPKQGEIYLEKLILRYNEGEVVFGPSEIKSYFRPNPYFEFDFHSMKGKTRIINNKYDPYLDSNNISKFVNKLILY